MQLNDTIKIKVDKQKKMETSPIKNVELKTVNNEKESNIQDTKIDSPNDNDQNEEVKLNNTRGVSEVFQSLNVITASELISNVSEEEVIICIFNTEYIWKSV